MKLKVNVSSLFIHFFRTLNVPKTVLGTKLEAFADRLLHKQGQSHDETNYRCLCEVGHISLLSGGSIHLTCP